MKFIRSHFLSVKETYPFPYRGQYEKNGIILVKYFNFKKSITTWCREMLIH